MLFKTKDFFYSYMSFIIKRGITSTSLRMAKQIVTSDKGLKSPLFSQATIHNGTVFVSGNVGIIPATGKLVEGSVGDRTVSAI